MRFFALSLLLCNAAFAIVSDADIILPKPDQSYFDSAEVIDDSVLEISRMLNLQYAFNHPQFTSIRPNFEYSKIDAANVEPDRAHDTLFQNAAFGNKHSMVMVYGGVSVRKGQIERYMGDDGKYKYNLGYGGIGYFQESSFLRIPARLGVELSFFKGRKDGMVGHTHKDFSRYDQLSLGIAQDLILGSKYFYFAPGLGIYMKDKNKEDDRISSRLHFGVRMAVGTSLGRFNLEVFMRHFSNGSMTDNNSGQNFIGATVAIKL